MMLFFPHLTSPIDCRSRMWNVTAGSVIRIFSNLFALLGCKAFSDSLTDSVILKTENFTPSILIYGYYLRNRRGMVDLESVW